MKNKGELSVPVAIIVAGLIVGAAIIFTNQDPSSSPVVQNDGVPTPPPAGEQRDATEFFKPVTADDHVRGNRDAKIMLVEYSDIDCPFCSRIHGTLTELVDEGNGDVAWAYRHLPLEQLHPNAFMAARATECIADQSEDLFWTYLDALFANGQSSSRDVLVAAAGTVGADVSALEICLDSDAHTERVQGQMDNAAELGFNGTPAVVIVGPEEGQLIPVSGAQPKSVFEGAIAELLK